MTTQTIITIILIGITAGILSGFVGVGGGILIVPALVYTMGMSQFEAQGTSLFVLLLPVGILAVMNYAKADTINWKVGIIISAAFVLSYMCYKDKDSNQNQCTSKLQPRISAPS